MLYHVPQQMQFSGWCRSVGQQRAGSDGSGFTGRSWQQTLNSKRHAVLTFNASFAAACINSPECMRSAANMHIFHKIFPYCKESV